MRLPFFILVSLLIGACAGTGEMGSIPEDQRGSVLPERFLDSEVVHTVQLHPGLSETALPVVELGSELQLRLAFDLVDNPARPLTVYFYHADREWNRDLMPAEYLRSFHQDDILDYRGSGATVLPYVHYEYAFPNRSIEFKMSGNYILRVSEQGREDDVLFERPFFVTEQSTPIQMQMDQLMVAGRRATSIQPFVRFQSPSPNASSFDYAVCFVRNAEIESGRCVDRPSLDVQPDISFYLQPEDSFEPLPANYFLDISEIRTGGRVERVNQGRTPWLLEIEPDYARFPGTQLAPFINGKTVIRAANKYITEPDYLAEYVDAVFKFVPPDGNRVSGQIGIAGSFSNWEVHPENILKWNELSSWYEVRLLLKQGHYEYAYVTDDESLNRYMNTGLPQLKNLYTSFVYYDDVFSRTDRLIAVQGVILE
jgi:hypothetical protein